MLSDSSPAGGSGRLMDDCTLSGSDDQLLGVAHARCKHSMCRQERVCRWPSFRFLWKRSFGELPKGKRSHRNLDEQLPSHHSSPRPAIPRSFRDMILMIMRSLTVLALLFLVTELYMALFVGGGLLLFRRGRFHEHDGFQPGFKPPNHVMVPDAIVMLSMGTSFRHTENSMSAVLRACACSIRHRGGYTGDIVIVTDQAVELDDDDMLKRYNVRIIKVPPVENLSRIWFTKCMLLEIIPPVYRSIMYMDSDILVTARLEGFFSTIPVFPEGVIGMFNDITTRFGRTERSDTYHGGMVLMQRNASESCLAGWCSRMQKRLSPADRLQWGKGEVEDDQEAIKAAVELERTCRVWFIPDRFMQFMADWQTMVFAPNAAFAHFTDSARKRLVGASGWFWEWMTLSERRIGGECLADARMAYLNTPRRTH